MSHAVTDVIVSRTREPEGLTKMIVWSAAAHAALIAMAILMPNTERQAPPRTVMTISLGGTPGPRSGGLTQMGARAVQAPRPPEPVRRPETAAAPPAPKMTIPDPKAQRRPQTRATQAPREAAARRPNTGEEPREGSARAETNVRRGQGFGLSSGGGSTGGPVQLDVANFCCPEYLEQMITLIQRNWNQNHGVVGTTVVKFTILRDGTIQAAQVERPSGFIVLDSAATRALQLTRLPPLPAAFTNPTLTVHMTFDYSS